MEFHGTFILGVAIPWNSMEFGVGTSSVKLSKFHGIPWNFPFDLKKFHGIPWNSMELWNIDINKFHNWGSVFHCFLYDFMSLYIRQSISSWNIEIFQSQSNFLVPLILVKWWYSILNGGLLLAEYVWLNHGKLPIGVYFIVQGSRREMHLIKLNIWANIY